MTDELGFSAVYTPEAIHQQHCDKAASTVMYERSMRSTCAMYAVSVKSEGM